MSVASPAVDNGRGRIGPVILHVVLIVAGVSMVFPFIWMVLTSFKTLPQLLNEPLSLWPNPWTVE
ncbi:MAG: hypothetical protein KIT69_18470, partial [Propionibacteriaceae bacterium]|nr:hypothetical protein [Propionibacteriaceae bacterium]